MLTNDESRRLDAIEQYLQRDDPALARRLAAWSTRRSSPEWFPIALIVIGAIGVVAGFAATSFPVLIAAGVVPLCVGMWLRRFNRSRT